MFGINDQQVQASLREDETDKLAQKHHCNIQYSESREDVVAHELPIACKFIGLA